MFLWKKPDLESISRGVFGLVRFVKKRYKDARKTLTKIVEKMAKETSVFENESVSKRIRVA